MAQRTVGTAVSPIVYEQLQAQAKREQKSMSELLREIINRDLLSVPSSDLEKEILAMRLEMQRLKSGLLTRTAANRLERQFDEMRAEMRQLVGNQPQWARVIGDRVEKIEDDLFYDRLVSEELKTDLLFDFEPGSEDEPVEHVATTVEQPEKPEIVITPVALRITQSKSFGQGTQKSTPLNFIKRLASNILSWNVAAKENQSSIPQVSQVEQKACNRPDFVI